MPEGHSVHRIARQFEQNFVGHRVDGRSRRRAVSPPGPRGSTARPWSTPRPSASRCSSSSTTGCGCACTSGSTARGTSPATSRRATRWPSRARAWGRPTRATGRRTLPTTTARTRCRSIGAPRTDAASAHGRAGEDRGRHRERSRPSRSVQVRVRLLTDDRRRRPARADGVRGARRRRGRAGDREARPRPAASTRRRRAASASSRRVRKKPTPIALLLMDQSVVSGIGNVYRAEMLFRARLNPHTPGQPGARRDGARALARLGEAAEDRRRDRPDDDDGRPRQGRVRQGAAQPRRPALGLPPRGPAVPGVRHAHRDGGCGGRKLYWCPTDQV